MKAKLNRIPYYFFQIEEYWFHGPQRRFAQDAGISETTFSRVLRGKVNPDYSILCKIVAHLEKKLHRKFDLRDLYQV